MFGSVFKNTAKNKEYRYREIVSKYPAQFTDTKRLSPPEPFPNYPRPDVPLRSARAEGSGVGYYDIGLPKYLSLLGYNDFIYFVQGYYEWLYTSNPSVLGGYGSEYFTTIDDVSKLIDIERIAKNPNSEGIDETGFIYQDDVRKTLLTNIVSQYAEGLENHPHLTPVFGSDETSIVDFIKDVRAEFYTKKTTKQAAQYYFSKLYPEIDAQTEIYEPKRNIIRLDDGVPEISNSNLDTDDGIYLQESAIGELVLHDNCFYHDYAYLLRVKNNTDEQVFELDASAQETYKTVAHPAGIQVIFNVENDDYVPPADFEGEFGAAETTILGNYIPYRLNDTEGLTYPSGCTYDLDRDGSGDNATTFNHPGWSIEIAEGTAFRNINIGDFFFLRELADSPNQSLPSCS